MSTQNPSTYYLSQVQTANDVRDKKGISTYGALILPFEVKKEKVEADKKDQTKKEGKFKSALKKAGQTIKNKVTHPVQSMKDLAKYMSDNRDKLDIITSKFSGIAVTQALLDGNVSSKEALDYLFMGFAPALNVQGSLMGYSGINQIKDALSNGRIDVGAFISGFTRTLKGATDLKDMLLNKKSQKGADIIEFDLTISHNETYQSETPDRRVQSGISLNEYIHNMPETIDVECALQEGKRYSKAEFRAILKYLRERKETVQLVLGDEIFDSLVLTNFNPSHDCSKSGMDYSLSFKKVYRNDITTREVTIQKVPIKVEDETKITSSSFNTGSLKKEFSKISKGLNQKDLPEVSGGITRGVNGSTFSDAPKAYFSHANRMSESARYFDNYYPPNMRLNK